MKKSSLFYVAPVLAAVAMLFQSNANGPAASNNRATGAPGDGNSSCVTCHGGNSFGSITIDMQLEDGQGAIVNEYVAGETYKLRLVVNNSSGSPAGYGIQTIALLDADNSSLNAWSNPSSNAKLSVSNNRQYMEHLSLSPTNEFTVDWSAPAPGSGPVTFYAGGNAVNGNGANSGDGAALETLNILESDSTANGIAMGAVQQNGFRVFPNPAQDILFIDERLNTNSNLTLYNVLGAEIMTTSIARNASLDISGLEPGTYILVDESTQEVAKFLKL